MSKRQWLGHEFDARDVDGNCGVIVDYVIPEGSGPYPGAQRRVPCGFSEREHGITPAERRLFAGIAAYFALALAIVITFWVVVFA